MPNDLHLIEMRAHHRTSPAQAEWLRNQNLQGLIDDTNRRLTEAVNEVVSKKHAIERDQRLTNNAKLSDIRVMGRDVVDALDLVLTGKIKVLKDKRDAVLQAMARKFESSNDSDEVKTLARHENLRTIERCVDQIDEESLITLRVKAELDDGSAAEVILLEAAELGDLGVVGAVSKAGPLWHHHHSIRPEIVDRARDTVIKSTDQQESGELLVLDEMIRGIDRGLKEVKAIVAEELGLPAHELDGSDPIAEMAA